MKVEISKKDSDYMYNFIQRIIDDVGCRMPCSKQEAMGAEIIRAEMEETCEEVDVEPFKCHPRAFLGWIRIDIILVLCSLGSFLLTQLFLGIWQQIFAIISFILNIIAFLIIWNEFFNYREFIDKLFKEKSSQNVVGKIKSEGETKRIIIFSGHHDSALQFNLLRYFKVGYGIIIFLGLGIMFIWIIISAFIFLLTMISIFTIIFIDYTWFLSIVIWLVVLGIVPIGTLFFFVSSGEKGNKVPGAVDNLSAVAVVLGVGRYVKNNREIIPKNTEIRLLSFGCEEAGLRGAYRYAAAHQSELEQLDAEVVNLDGIQSAKNLVIIEFEPTTRTKHSTELCGKLINASKSVGIPTRKMGSSFIAKLIGQISGGTDATAFSKAGIKATNLTAMEIKKFLKFYHQPTDTVEMIETGALENALKVCIGYLINESKPIQK
jgi:hypothetical protein